MGYAGAGWYGTSAAGVGQGQLDALATATLTVNIVTVYAGHTEHRRATTRYHTNYWLLNITMNGLPSARRPVRQAVVAGDGGERHEQVVINIGGRPLPTRHHWWPPLSREEDGQGDATFLPATR